MSLFAQRPPRTRAADGINEIIKYRLRKLKEKYPDRQEYIPEGDLRQWVTENAIGSWVEASKIDTIDPHGLKEQITRCALKTFCILIEMRREDYITEFIQCSSESNPDGKLCWTSPLALGQTLDIACARNKRPRWDQSTCKEFYARQWKYVVRSFTIGKDAVLLNGEILPFFSERRHHPGKSTLYEVDFDGRYLRSRQNEPLQLGSLVKMMRKEIDLSQNQDESLIMQYLRARLSRESKPDIIQLYVCYRHKQKAYILMPMFGGDLKALLTKDEQCDYFETDDRYMNEMWRVSRALASLHAIPERHQLFNVAGIHHDLKPDNILIDSGRFVLADLGLSTLTMPTSGPEMESTGHRTWYTAPEGLDNGGWRGATSQRSDVFSLGCVFTELLVHMRGRKESVSAFRQRRKYKPSFGSSVFATETNINEQVTLELERILQDQTGGKRSQVASIVLEMLAFDPDARPLAETVSDRIQLILERTEPESILTVDEAIQPQHCSPLGLLQYLYALGAPFSIRTISSGTRLSVVEVLSTLKKLCKHKNNVPSLTIASISDTRVQGPMWISEFDQHWEYPKWASRTMPYDLILHGGQHLDDMNVLRGEVARIVLSAADAGKSSFGMTVLPHSERESEIILSSLFAALSEFYYLSPQDMEVSLILISVPGLEHSSRTLLEWIHVCSSDKQTPGPTGVPDSLQENNNRNRQRRQIGANAQQKMIMPDDGGRLRKSRLQKGSTSRLPIKPPWRV